MNNTLGLAICNNYIKELETVVKQLAYEEILTFPVPTICLNTNKSVKTSINEKINKIREQVGELIILIPNSCIGCEFTVCNHVCSECTLHSTCLELIIPKSFIDQLILEGNFIITPGWLYNWKQIVFDTWKFNENQVKSYFNNNSKRICVLNTGIYDDFQTYLDEFKLIVNEEINIINIGLDFFSFKVEKIINQWIGKRESIKFKDARKRMADYSMAFEIFKDVSSQTSEKQLIFNISNLFTLLFSPQNIVYTPIYNNEMGNPEVYSENDNLSESLKKNGNKVDFELLESKKGFRIIASYNNEKLGIIEVDDVLFTEHIDSYISLISSIASVLGLLIYNAREYGKILKEKVEILSKSEKDLKKKNEELQLLYQELQSSEEEIRASVDDLRIKADELEIINQELEEAKLRAEESDRLKTSFLHNMSHEIRTPLNAIIGFSEMMVFNFNDKAKLSHFAGIIDKRGHDLLEIVDEILDISRIESNQMLLHFENCNLQILLNDVFEFFIEYQKNINKEQIKFTVKNLYLIDNLIIHTDGLKLKQILINLINNAFKFTHKGLIEFGIQKIENKQLFFYVKDTGIGIPKEKFEYIFERFVQENSDITRLYGGAGLGLSIVSGLLNLLKGNIWLESELDKGSCFYFTIPYEVVLSEANPLEVANNKVTAPDKGKILIVEDDKFNTEYLKEVLFTLPYEIMHVSTGKEAIEKSLQIDFNLVLMDIRLPDISGFETTRLIKAHKPQMVIIAQSAYATANDRSLALESGCIDFLSKPIKRDMILSKIRTYLSYF
jgi:two-component system, sensor histidine kinase